MFKKLLAKKSEGFTLIEIVLVLAIAGLIMVIVFAAVSGAQAARRDTQRKTDISRLRAAVEQFAGNNNGNSPSTAAQFDVTSTSGLKNYMPATYQDPNGNTYDTATNFTTSVNTDSNTAKTAPTNTTNGRLTIVYKGKCGSNGGNAITFDGGTNKYAVLYLLEQGGVQCADNQ